MITDGVLNLSSFAAVTIGILVLFLGRRLNASIKFLREFSIPEAVSGGLLVSLLVALVYLTTKVEIQFDLAARDTLLVYFFTTIGINSSLKDLAKGGKPLGLLLVITIGFMFLQNLTGIAAAKLSGLPEAAGVIGGSVSLIGGHGTAIAWAPRIQADYGVSGALEMGMACATMGLVLASLMGGPIARFLINRHNLKPSSDTALEVGVTDEKNAEPITYLSVLDAILALHICIALGVILNEVLKNAGLQLPLFVTCLFGGILVTNFRPRSWSRFTGLEWPARNSAIALIADISLGTFLAMSLMSMQLWTLAAMAGPIFTIMGFQLVLAIVVVLFIVFPVMGKNYDAAVISAGFGGFSMGATPTAMANMTAVTQKYGPSQVAFIVVPLVGAFFIDLANAFIIPFFLDKF